MVIDYWPSMSMAISEFPLQVDSINSFIHSFISELLFPIWTILTSFCRARKNKKLVFKRRFFNANCMLSAVIFASLVRVWAATDTTLLRTIFRAVSEQFQSSYRAVLEQFQSSFRAVSEQFQSSLICRFLQICKSAVIFASLVRVWASKDTTLLRTIFRAVLEQFRAV